jgi:hypothetical protein
VSFHNSRGVSLDSLSEANVAGEHCGDDDALAVGAGRAMLGARDGRSAQPARRYVVTEQPENGVRS